ncbi:uncharacterized UPF0146 family protein [Methanomicrobium sp. W14]|uniref:UPF0146 family protein n=1 Tax=Methanomicrobium sp. W14 TaxID=2817839 RepID=UPI001AE3B743|nr:UPF0146 family protein [Methanomicrobium sp. W14]MBP2133197.1 uncharacterized UPF0146 family protein [Methanomicrobium sp. W14]
MERHNCIEETVFRYLMKYPKNIRFVEVGIGKNPYIAQNLKKYGYRIKATDIKRKSEEYGVEFTEDDIFDPDLNIYSGSDVIYSVRPGIEMVPALISTAKKSGCELIVYHLGDEVYKDGGRVTDCGVILHRYYIP